MIKTSTFHVNRQHSPTNHTIHANCMEQIEIQLPETTDLKSQNTIQALFERGDRLEP